MQLSWPFSTIFQRSFFCSVSQHLLEYISFLQILLSRTFDVSKYIRYITIEEDTDEKSKVSISKIFAIYYQDSKAVKISVIKSGYIVNCICNAWLQKFPEQTQTVTSSPANASFCVWHCDSTGMLSVISITVIRVGFSLKNVFGCALKMW